MQIKGRRIGRGHKPFIIAEMSGNHNQSLDRALDIVRSAANTGADAIKLQTYTADTMTLDINDREFVISEEGNLWQGETLFNLYQKAYTPWEWHEPIMTLANKLDLICFSSPFDASAVDFLESLGVPAYKVASFECTDLELVKKISATGKPMIISTGMATAAEIDETVRTVRSVGDNDFVLLKCTSTYPASPENTHISTLGHMRDLFRCEVGLSDHTFGIGVSIAGVALGASVIEKHFTLSRADGGVDSAFSIEACELKSLVLETERAWQALGHIHYGPTCAEQDAVKARRSLYISQDIKRGECITKDNLKAIRPGLGLPTKYLAVVLGRAVRDDVKKGTPLSWDLI